MAMIFQEPLTSLNPLLTVGSQIYEQVKNTHSRDQQNRLQSRLY